ncbi:MAG: insulinase family protein [Sporolactobacillus sp.]
MPSFEPGHTYHGFNCLHAERVEDIHSQIYQFEHVKSGAKLLAVHNSDDNKVFSISFRTPPADDTGVFHILEHSVLCGSEKYPVKEPFVELLKGSLNTFLNAFTFSDKTMYPVASRNDKDFQNLIDVYMDAVLRPNIYQYKEILQQEGWHYELDTPSDQLRYKGVVYNEMKGAFSSPEGLLMRANQASLFPDTPYSFESGGDPATIPNLTYEQFLADHRRFYSPANSYIYLYGDMAIDEKLAYLDSDYLSHYERITVKSALSVQKPLGALREIRKSYPILADEQESHKTYLSLNFAIGEATDPENYLACDVLTYILLDSPAAPLKKALLEAGIGKDVFGICDNGIHQPYLSVAVKNTDPDQKDRFQSVVFETLNALVTNGIDKKLIEAAINVKEFQLREADYGSMPKGLIYSMAVMDSWLYGGDPLTHLRFEKTLSTIKSALTSDYFEQMIKRSMIESTHRTLVVVTPSRTLAAEEETALNQTLEQRKADFSSADIERIVSETKQLRARQQQPDSAEDLRKLPVLSLEDIDPHAEVLPTEKRTLDGVPVLYHKLPTNKIIYLSLYFDASGVKPEQIPYIALLQELLGRVATEHDTYESLANAVNIETGDLHFQSSVFTDKDSENDYTARFVLKTKLLPEKAGPAFALIHDILYESRLGDKQRVKALIQETRSRLEMFMNQSGQSIAVRRLSASYSKSAACKEQLSGLSFYQFISRLETQFDKLSDDICANLTDVARRLFTRSGLLIGLTADEQLFAAVQEQFAVLGLAQAAGERTTAERVPLLSETSEGLMTPSKVQYAAKGGDFKALGFSYSGSLLVLKQILTLDYLWNKVRVQGGAYGCGISLHTSGSFVFWSYRDPNLQETLAVYNEASAFAERFADDDFSLTKYVIGTISELDSPLSARAKGETADEHWFSHVTQSDVQHIRDDVLAVKQQDIQALAPLLKQIAGQPFICVFGNEAKIKASQSLFQKCTRVFD